MHTLDETALNRHMTAATGIADAGAIRRIGRAVTSVLLEELPAVDAGWLAAMLPLEWVGYTRRGPAAQDRLEDFYDRVADLTRYAMGARAVWRRLAANGLGAVGLFNLFRGATTGRPRYQAAMARMMRKDRGIRAYFEGESDTMPGFFEARIRNDLGPLWDALPAGALSHDPYAYLNSEVEAAA